MNRFELAEEPWLDNGVEVADKPQDECGVVGVWAPGEPVATLAYQAMHGLQHRGQSGAGLFVHHPDFGMFGHKGLGMVDSAIVEAVPKDGVSSLDTFTGSPVAVGHTRYSTSPENSIEATQPFRGENITLSHNGHVEGLDSVALIFGIDVSKSVSDSHKLTTILDNRTGELGSIEKAMGEVLPHIDGAYCLVATDGQRMVVARDPWSFHPLALGSLPDNKGYMVASEAAALTDAGAEFVRDIESGEIVTIDNEGISSAWIRREEPRRECMIEYVYTARADDAINGVNVYAARKNMGRALAEDHPIDADVVVAVPNSGVPAAAGYAEAAGLPRVEGIMLSPYVGRSFIERGAAREQILRRKFRFNQEEVEGRRVVLVDDSVIKGNTMAVLIDMVREAGATEVHVLSAAPKYLYPCYMGLDTGDPSKLIARGRSDEEIALKIGADSVGFNTPERIEEAVARADRTGKQAEALGRLCTACATGEYPFPVPAKKTLLGIPVIRRQVTLPLAGY